MKILFVQNQDFQRKAPRPDPGLWTSSGWLRRTAFWYSSVQRADFGKRLKPGHINSQNPPGKKLETAKICQIYFSFFEQCRTMYGIIAGISSCPTTEPQQNFSGNCCGEAANT